MVGGGVEAVQKAMDIPDLFMSLLECDPGNLDTDDDDEEEGERVGSAAAANRQTWQTA